MAMPRKLKNMNLFNDGNSYLGVCKSVTLPTLARKMEARAYFPVSGMKVGQFFFKTITLH